jgi:hypothetical protein
MTLTPDMIKEALVLCNNTKAGKCLECPLYRPGKSCREILAWADYSSGGYFLGGLGSAAIERLSRTVAEDLCDPLYMDMLKVKETCNDTNT